MCVSINIFVCEYVRESVEMSGRCIYVCLTVCRFVWLSDCVGASMYVSACACMSVSVGLCISKGLCARMYESMCLSVCVCQ